MESSTGDKKKIGGFLVYERRRRKGTKSGKSISNPNENTSSHSESCPAKTDGELKHAIGEDGAIAKKLAELSVKDKEDTTIVGGENSVAAVQKVGPADKMSHTASGASSELLEEKSPPGVLALNDAEQK